MQIQPITQQPSFSGKLVIDKGSRKYINEQMKDRQLIPKFKEVAGMIMDKPYDLFIYEDKTNPGFYYVAANKTVEQAKEIKEYTVKIQSDIMTASIVDAAKDAIDMYEKFINKAKNFATKKG
jgi:hypothetical protein